MLPPSPAPPPSLGNGFFFRRPCLAFPRRMGTFGVFPSPPLRVVTSSISSTYFHVLLLTSSLMYVIMSCHYVCVIMSCHLSMCHVNQSCHCVMSSCHTHINIYITILIRIQLDNIYVTTKAYKVIITMAIHSVTTIGMCISLLSYNNN